SERCPMCGSGEEHLWLVPSSEDRLQCTIRCAHCGWRGTLTEQVAEGEDDE
ncbi:hypothetical protein LCGC14_2918930, partial [marine sediment metagenome]